MAAPPAEGKKEMDSTGLTPLSSVTRSWDWYVATGCRGAKFGVMGCPVRASMARLRGSGFVDPS